MKKILIKKLSHGKLLPVFTCGNEVVDKYYEIKLIKVKRNCA